MLKDFPIHATAAAIDLVALASGTKKVRAGPREARIRAAPGIASRATRGSTCTARHPPERRGTRSPAGR